jgi:hypothetical protein
MIEKLTDKQIIAAVDSIFLADFYDNPTGYDLAIARAVEKIIHDRLKRAERAAKKVPKEG